MAGETEARRRKGVLGECGRGRSRPTALWDHQESSPAKVSSGLTRRQVFSEVSTLMPSYTRELRPRCPAGKWQERSEL